ncbi:MAG: helix-turn-helix domain-containing protein [Gammaproteobacteria bacterium]|nr:helix-turn-helix domain-containing protein [Gammaproteobacteria bacterium]
MAKGKIKRTEPEDLDDLVFKALAGKDRRRILDLLRDAPMTTGEIGKNLPHLDRTTVMQHLGVLENARLIISKKQGRCRWNYLDVGPIQRIHERWISTYAAPSAMLLSKLQADIEAG